MYWVHSKALISGCFYYYYSYAFYINVRLLVYYFTINDIIVVL
jgi:hypothetical protein